MGAATKRAKHRLDVELVERGLAPSRERAQALILAGAVCVEGEVVRRAALGVAPDAAINARTEPEYVGRGAEKLAGALDAFGIDPAGKACADVGASTGGFTDVLLRRGARRVYAIDVGRGQLAWRLRQDPRVVVLEGTNARELGALPEKVDLVVADVSFISLRLALPPLLPSLREDGEVVALVKPQFEAGREKVERGGVVRDPRARAEAVLDVIEALAAYGLGAQDVVRSSLTGREGNVEIFAHLRKGPPRADVDLPRRAAEEGG